ncbi:uncharacterized protein LOC131010818 isoform X2 [Salvia miltiorrhiza]|uniref:uncharacterized protein LOC131010818 isoform X2 n=1 Tax=Salvia miltiorrhiza TaxID=226208 RepID=UPI0025ACB9D7|nr:uncharacterized protein LOC131010818 isoform X2 [Salvia miltiorrhiza]
MHAKTHSEVGSLAPSSPDRNRPAYYVQSPSHDGEKTTASVTSTPILSSPVGSPRHSRESSTSAPLKPGSCSRKVSSGSERRDDGFTNWEFDLMEDEEDGEPPDQLPPPCFFFAFFVVVFLLFSLILWGLSKHQKPNITMQSIKFERFTVQAGSDSSGVSTDMISLNSTLNFKYRNTATFFGVHVSSTPVSLSYSQLNIAFASRILQEEEARKECECGGERRQHSHVWKRGEPHHPDGDVGVSGDAQVGGLGWIKSSCFGEAGEAEILQQG